MRRFRWFLGLMMIFGMVASPLLTVWAEDGTPVVVDEPVSTEPDATEPVATEPIETVVPTDEPTEAPESTVTNEPVTVEPSDAPVFSGAAAPVLTVGGSTSSPALVPFGGQTTVAISGLDANMLVFFYTAPNGCPQDDTSRTMFSGPVQGNTSFPRTGPPGTTEYLQAQLYGGEWSNCIQVNWIAPPTATSAATNTATAAPDLLAGTYLGTLNDDTQISLAASDWFQYQGQNIPALFFFMGAGCAPSNYGYALPLPSGVINPAALVQENQLIDGAFSIQGYSGSIDAGGQPITTCRTVTVSGLPTATATSAETPVPSLLVNNLPDTLIQLNLGDWVDVTPTNLPVLVWFNGGGCQAANFRYETASPGASSFNTNGFDSSWFIDNQFSLQGYSGSFNAAGQPVTTCRTIEVLGRPTATATDTMAPSATATATIDPSVTPASILTVNDGTGTVSAVNGHSVHVVVSGIPPGGTTVLYWNPAGCPATADPAGQDLIGLVDDDGDGVASANRGGLFDTTLYYQANDGQWSNCVRVDWSAAVVTPTATATIAAPVLTVNGGSGPVSVLNGQSVNVVVSGVTPGAIISLYWNATGCPQSSDPGGTDGTALRVNGDGVASSTRNGLANATLYYQALDSNGPGWSSCVRVDWSTPPTATNTATATPTNTPTITPTPGPEILINGAANALTTVQPGDSVAVTTVNVLYAQIYADGNCSMAYPTSIPGDTTVSKTAAEWQALAAGSFLYSFRGFDGSNQPVTECRVVSVAFTPVANVVLDIDGSTAAVIQRTGGIGVTANVTGADANSELSLFTSVYSCPYQAPGATAQYDLTADGNGKASASIFGESDVTRYIQAQLADGSWTACIQVVWSATPTATIPSGAMIFTVNGQTSGTLTVNPDDVITAHAENVSTLIAYSEGNCGGMPAYTYGAMLNNSIVDVASNWAHTPSFSMQAHGMDSSTGNCITINITQPTATTAPTDTATATGTLVATETLVPSATPVPVLLVNGGTDSLVQVNLGSSFSLHLQDFPKIVWFHGGGCDTGNFWYESAVGYPDLSYNTSGFDPSVFINNQISIRGYSGSVDAGGQPVTTCRTIEVLGLPTATPTETPVPSMTPTVTATATQQVLVMTVNGSTNTPVNVSAGAMVSMVTSGLVPGGDVQYGYSQAGCPASVSSPGLQGPYSVGNDGTHTFQSGGISGVTWYYQAQQNGVWSNCIQIVWAAEATATPVPQLLVNDSTNTVTHVDYFAGSIAVDWSGIPLLNLYPNTDCSGTPSLSYSAGAGSRAYSAMSWATTVGGYVFSLRGFTSPNPTAITNCRTVIMDNAPVTPSATTVPTDTATATTEPTATNTATATQQALVLTANGGMAMPVQVPGGTVATMLVAGLTPGGTVAYGASQTGCPSSVASSGMQGPFAVGGDGTYTFQAGGIAGATWYYQAQQNGVWSNCLQLIWGATLSTPTATPMSPYLFVNDDDAAVVHINYPTSSVWLRWHDIPLLNVYPSADCSGIPVTSFSVSGYGNDYRLSPAWATLIGGNVFSLQGFAPPSPGAITSCHTVILDNAPSGTATSTATTAPTATSAATATATAMPTETATNIVTATATATTGPNLTINGSSDPVVHVSITGDITITFEHIAVLWFYANGDCSSGGENAFWDSDPYTRTSPASGWQDAMSGAPAFSMRGFDASDHPITDCRTVVFDAPPTPTATAVPALTINGSTASEVHVPSTGTVALVWTNIPFLALYQGASCDGQDPRQMSGGDPYGNGSRSNPASAMQDALGSIFSFRGYAALPGSSYPPDPDQSAPLTTCRTVVIDPAATATSTTAPTETYTATTEPSATATSTSANTVVPTNTVAPTNTATPLTNPPLAIDGSTASKNVTLTTEVHLVTDANAKINYWYASDCTGGALGTLPSFSAWVSWDTPMVVSFQAYRNQDPTKVSACLTVTWADMATETPAPTDTATAMSTPTETMVATATSVPSNTPAGTATNTPTNTPTATNEPAKTATSTSTETSVPTNTPTVTTAPPTVTETVVPTSTAAVTETLVPTQTATAEPTETSTMAPTATQVPPTATPTPTATVPVGSLQIQLDTSDGGNIPAGTTWMLSEGSAIGSPSGAGRFFAAQVSGAQGGTLATELPSGSLLPIANPLALGTYTLTIDAPGYRAFVETITLDDDAVSFTARLIAIPVATSTATSLPTGTVASVTPAPTKAAVSDLPKTGAGTPGSGSWPLIFLMIAGGFAIGGVALGFRMRRR